MSRAEDDGDGRVDVGVGAAHHGGEPRAEVDLQQRVDPGEEEDGLDHDRLLMLRSAHRLSVLVLVPGKNGKGDMWCVCVYMYVCMYVTAAERGRR